MGNNGIELNYRKENESVVTCTESPKYSQTTASHPRLLDRFEVCGERERDRNVEKGCSTPSRM